MLSLVGEPVKKPGPKKLKVFYVVYKDGTVQEVHANSFAATSDGMWSFYLEETLDKVWVSQGKGGAYKSKATADAVVPYNAVKGIFNAAHVVLESMIEKNTSRSLKTEVRKKTPKKARPTEVAE